MSKMSIFGAGVGGWWGDYGVWWSDLPLFCDFRKLTNISDDQVYFYEFKSKKAANFAAHEEKYSFSKNHRDLKINILSENLQIPSVSIKEHSQKSNSKF